jgi:hypothetical protein
VAFTDSPITIDNMAFSAVLAQNATMSNLDQLRHIDQLRQRQEQRLLPVLESWNTAKKHLEMAIAMAEAKEREYHEVQEDVRRNLDALVLVIRMARDMGSETAAKTSTRVEETQPVAMISENTRSETKPSETAETSHGGIGSLLRKTSRPLFASLQRSA